MALKDELPLDQPAMGYVRDEPRTAEPPAGEIEVVEAKVVDAATELTTDKKLAPAIQETADKFIAGLKDGLTPAKAAKEAGTELQYLMANPETAKLVKGLVGAFRLPATIRREMVRAKLNQALLVGGVTKEQLTAAKLISQDPEVGLESKSPDIAVQINTFNQDVWQALNQAETVIPGLEKEEESD